MEQERKARARHVAALGALLDAPADGPDALLPLVEAAIASSSGLDSGAVLTPSEGGFAVRAAVGIREGTRWIEGTGLAAEVVHERRAVLASSATGLGAPFSPGTLSAVGVPIRSRGGVAGVAVAGSRSTLELSEEDRLLLQLLAERAGREIERAALVQALTEAETLARRTAGFRDQVLGIVGHDLRNPLGAIVMSASLLQSRGGLAGWQQKTVGRVRSSAARMERIISDLLSYTRTRLGSGIPIEKRPADLGELARKVVDELVAYHPDSSIEVEAEGDLGGEWDPSRIEQAISNLVANAVDHGEPDGPVHVVLRGEAEAVRVEVANRGEIPKHVVEHAFQPFSRAPDSGGRKSTGLGLGLFIAREIVRGHGGDIRLRSGGGETAIAFELPRRSQVEAASAQT
jgi:signal transduction histidine kinase